MPFVGKSTPCIFLTDILLCFYSLPGKFLLSFNYKLPEDDSKFECILLGKSDNLSDVQTPQLYNVNELSDFLVSLASLKFWFYDL